MKYLNKITLFIFSSILIGILFQNCNPTLKAIDKLNSENTATSTAGNTDGILAPPPLVVANGSVGGLIDSSLLNRFNLLANAIYIYDGSVTPDDKGGSGSQPKMIISINQSTCQFSYNSPVLSPGTYTVAFTNQADQDNPGVNDAITFYGTKVITINSNNATKYDFLPKGKVFNVGSSRTYKKPSAAINVASDGDIIEIDPEEYDDDFTYINSAITLRGILNNGVRPKIKYTGNNVISNGKGIWVNSSKINVEYMEFDGAMVPDQNGAGIRVENDIAICGVYIHDGEDGILGDANNFLIEYSELARNGRTHVGFNHNIYMNGGTCTYRFNYIHDANDPNNQSDTGHNLKTRCDNNYILYNRIMNTLDGGSPPNVGSASDQINIPNAGLTYIVGNIIHESQYSNSNRIIMYYDPNDGAVNPSRVLYVVNNTIVDDHGENFITIGDTTVESHIYNNVFWGSKTSFGFTPNYQGNNVFLGNSSSNMFVDKNNYDYHLTANATNIIDKALDLSSIIGFPYNSLYEYVKDENGKPRVINNVLDIGAFEK